MSRFILSVVATLALGLSHAFGVPAVKVTESDQTITVTCAGKPVLTYQKAVVPPPEGADPLYARSGFLHPVHAPSGAVLTGIHPSDHIHHVGLWHPWVNTKFRGRAVDFWNLKKGLGTVRYAKTLQITETGFTVEQEHLDLKAGESPEVVLREEFTIDVNAGDGIYKIDYTTSQKNVTDAPLVLPQNRYGGGIAYRAPASWNNSNSDYLSSEGKTRIDGHTTRSRWVSMFGATGKGDSTLTILNRPSNHDHPQRMRVWPPSSHDGAIFFNYCPVQETGWKIEAGETSVMRYRILTYDGRPDPAEIDQHWEDFASEKASPR